MPDRSFVWIPLLCLVFALGAGPAAGGHSSFIGEGQQLSADGRYLVFVSSSPDLVAGQVDVNQTQTAAWYESGDIFLVDREAHSTTLVSHSAASATTTGNSYSRESVISRDGRYVAFTSRATDLVAGQISNEGRQGLQSLQGHRKRAAKLRRPWRPCRP